MLVKVDAFFSMVSIKSVLNKTKTYATGGTVIMKEQDAAHSFERDISIVPFLLGSDSYDGIWWGDAPTNRPPFWWRTFLREEFVSKEAELTRLRSELQDTKSYYEDKLDARQRTIDQQFSELQQERELRKELVNRLEAMYNSDDGSVKDMLNEIDSIIREAKLNN